MNIWLRKCKKCKGQTDFENCHICKEERIKKEELENGERID